MKWVPIQRNINLNLKHNDMEENDFQIIKIFSKFTPFFLDYNDYNQRKIG